MGPPPLPCARRLPGLLLAAVGCGQPPGSGRPARPASDVPLTWATVPAPPGAVGFGAALAWGPDGLWVSAPHGPDARVYLVPAAAPPRAAWTGAAGSGLHLGPRPDGELWISAPLGPGGGGVEDLRGAEVRSGEGAGGALIGGPPGLIAEQTGVWVEGEGLTATPFAPAALAAAAGSWAAGMQDGALAAWGPEGEVLREVAGEGHQIALGDFYGDGRLCAALGDPTTGEIRVVRWQTGETEARLAGEGPGLTLSAADHDGDGFDDLLVGWPFAGPDRRGAAALHRGGAGGLSPVARWRGEEPGGWLGAAVALGPGRVAIGAPGGFGRVWAGAEGLSAASSGTAPSRR